MSDIPGNAKVSRKLAAILAADIAGYSALMGADEGATVRDLKGHQAVILPTIGKHDGRVIDTAGDGILAEFGSVVNAVECAIAIQKTLVERNAQVEEVRRMQFRIGVNQGDVIHDETRVYGDGVNIAARLESIAEPGGICVSGKVYDEITGKIPATFQDLGLQQLKNITQLVRVYRVQTEQLAVPSAQTRPALALLGKPSIAVLPFSNLSSDPEQEYLADGIVEDITTELSRFSELFVIARNSSFQYKGKSPDTRQVGRQLGVRYILEGSIRRRGDRLRISAQLIDAFTGGHLWAEHYDRELEEVFAVQDDLVRTIVAILAAHVRKAETERTRAKPPNGWQAYDYYLKGVEALNSFNKSLALDDLYETRRLMRQSLAIDPIYARSYAVLAGTYIAVWINRLDGDFLSPGALDQSHQFARKAVELDANLPEAHAALGFALMFRREHDLSIAAFEKAVALNPNYVNWPFGAALVFAGDARRAIDVINAYVRLDPLYAPAAYVILGFAYYMLKQYAKALSLLRDIVSRSPKVRTGHVLLAATYAQMGKLEEARAAAAEVIRLEPTYTIGGIARPTASFKDPKDDEHYFDGLRKAGLPE
jgi:adenylate cyclase